MSSILINDENTSYKMLCFSTDKGYLSIDVPDKYKDVFIAIFEFIHELNHEIIIGPKRDDSFIIFKFKDPGHGRYFVNLFRIHDWRISDRVLLKDILYFSYSDVYETVFLIQSLDKDYCFYLIRPSYKLFYKFSLISLDEQWIEEIVKWIQSWDKEKPFDYYTKQFFMLFSTGNRISIILGYSKPYKVRHYLGVLVYSTDDIKVFHVAEGNFFIVSTKKSNKTSTYVIRYKDIHISLKEAREKIIDAIDIHQSILLLGKYNVLMSWKIYLRAVIVSINQVVVYKYSMHRS